VGDHVQEHALIAVVSGTNSGVELRLSEPEAVALRRLATEVQGMLDSEDQHDPVLSRLFPKASDDADEARAFDELVSEELHRSKEGALALILETVPPTGPAEIVLSAEQSHTWLTGLNDIRLALGTRLEVTPESMSAELDLDDPRSTGLAVLHWLGYLQEAMLQELRPTLG
jgi:Domain of unknown function (DUF2017)